MKKVIITAIIILAIGVIITLVRFLPLYTMRYCEVVNQEGNLVTFVDNSGHEWMFYCEEGDHYEVGEMIKATMHDGWSERTRVDDRVVSVERW